ncbi:ABC transporter permease [Ruegeria atlantica]|uniref:Lipoprotein releasing system, transmembrane protein, LolC/E family n=1 Tax=Ruegeria atlantica TaxID=81569 RepID=A0A0N7LPA5_9RHOB|nr:FtsX-like permease family protein [Ruegeria atlantica]CUH44676.1 lipoprotein releasing system, transmembrane protein, LolC/E family [Ruegeria atlantica]
MSPLDKKMVRTLHRYKGQAVAIAIVIALGVMTLVMMTGLASTLSETRSKYYERYRLADVFAPAARAPQTVLQHLASLPGVTAVEGRVTGGALITLEEAGRPVRATALSIPRDAYPLINNYMLTSGRTPRVGRNDEVLLLQSFADAVGLAPGDSLSATMNGARRTFVVVGLAQSPEFIYIAAPGEMVPDDTRFAVLWMLEDAMAAAFDMKGAFNEALLLLSRNANTQEVIAGANRLLDKYGGLGAYGLEDQASNRFVMEEIAGLRATVGVVPPVFLAIAAFLLNIVIARMIQSEREQIGILKAFGYTSLEIGIHYFKLVLVIALCGAVLGGALGVMSGRLLSGVYQTFYKFPFLVFQISASAFVLGVLVSVLAASAGAILVLRSVFSLTPAIAMRPPAPVDYSGTGAFGPRMRGLLDQPTRMVMRRIARQPGRILGAIVGIACGMALSVGMVSILAGFDKTIDMTFSVIDRSDAMVSFTHPLSDTVQYELASLDGVNAVEPFRVVPVEFRHGLRHYRGAVNGLREGARLNRALKSDLEPVELHTNGIVLSTALAKVLDAEIDDTIEIAVLEGRRPNLTVQVTGVAETLLGSPAYMSLEGLNRILKEPGRVSAVYLSADSDRLAALQLYFADMPRVAGISVKRDAEQAMQKIMNEGAGSTRYVMALIAAVITFGIIYNTARISFAESMRDLASLRVIGFTKGEASFVLLGELAVVILVALPLGALMGYFLSFAISAGFSTDIYQVPSVFNPSGYGTAVLVVLGASVVSGWIVKRDVDRVNLVDALKIKE